MAGETVAERYELVELVGTGGMSSVFRAHDRVLERDVALKILHDRLVAEQDVVDRFSREAKLVAGLSHRNIVAVIDRGEHDGKPFIVLEYVAGENLKRLITREGPLPVDRALELAIEIARGLTFAHDQGFVHRDVKPQNVLLNGSGEAKVTDFGIARPLEVQEGETQTGTVLGTCDYISPEQAQGRRVDPQSDVYSLGIVLYELLTATVPFGGDNFVAVAMQHINTPPPPVVEKRPDVPPRVDAAVAKALAKDPADRFETMATFRDELAACLAEVRAEAGDGETFVLRPSKAATAKTKPARKWRRWGAVAALLALIAGAIATLLLVGTGSGGPAGGSSAPPPPVHLKAVRSYDPFGNNKVESPGLVPFATDGNQSTAWRTETYYTKSLQKPGVGIVLDAGAPVKAESVTISSDTPGFQAIIRAGSSEDGPFADDSASQTAGTTTTFALDGHEARYYLIWITSLGNQESVDINEATAK